MNVSLDNPYGNVTIPRAKLAIADNSTVIVNPMALESTNAKSAKNPYAADPAANGESAQGPPGYDGRKSYTVKDDDEEVGRCPACCYRCRRRK